MVRYTELSLNELLLRNTSSKLIRSLDFNLLLNLELLDLSFNELDQVTFGNIPFNLMNNLQALNIQNTIRNWSKYVLGKRNSSE